MGKLKKSSSDQVRQKKKAVQVKENPFEVKFNKQHHNVLGRKGSKHDKGKPGMARNRAMQKRKETLLLEYQKRGKANKFVDRRIGENDPELSVEEKMLKRFAAERQKVHEKSNVYSLNDEEELTHYGQSLSEIEKFEDIPQSDSEDEDEGRISAKLVSEEHFGGFLTKKEFEDQNSKKSWKERMEEVITQSKRAKYEKQKLKEEALQMTKKLDDEWLDIRMLMTKSKRKKDDETNKPQKDDYDIAVRELQFEIKGKATDRLKSEEELAKEEKERLEKLEADRLRRMRGITEEEESEERQQVRSADDLDDGFALDTSVKPRFHVSYKDGKLLGDKMEEEAEDDEDGDDSQGDDEGSGQSEAEDEDEESSDAMEHTSDLESEKDDSEDEMETALVATEIKTKPTKSVDLKVRKQMMEQARKELPYTFTAPHDVEELLTLLDEYNTQEQLTVIERLRKCHHPSLAEGNTEKLQNIGKLLLEYFGIVAGDMPPNLSLLDHMTKHLYELTQQFPLAMGQCMLDLLKTRVLLFQEVCEKRGGKGYFPELDTLLYLKLVSVLFPTSDFRHPVVTPAGLLMSQLLTQCSVKSPRDIAAGLFICNLFLEYVCMSKRFVPEALNFLHGLLFLASVKEEGKVEAVIPPFKPVGTHVDLLELKSENNRSTEVALLSVADALACSDVSALQTDSFRLSAISTTLRLLCSFGELYSDLPSFCEVFSPIRSQCSKLPVDSYPDTVQNQVKELLILLSSKDNDSRSFLTYKKKKPKAFKQYEPKVEDSFDGKKKHGGNRDFNEKQRLIHKHKKALKGATREIRKDNQFLARQSLQEQMQRDAERREKVKEIQGLLSQQEGDFKALKRKKDKM